MIILPRTYATVPLKSFYQILVLQYINIFIMKQHLFILFHNIHVFYQKRQIKTSYNFMIIIVRFKF